MLHTDVTSTLIKAVASAAHSKAAGGAVASCARRAMEVLTVLINVSTEVGRPPEQVRRLIDRAGACVPYMLYPIQAHRLSVITAGILAISCLN